MKEIITTKIHCCGIRTSGYWKGYKCSAIAKHEYKGKWYCKNHLPVPIDTEMDLEYSNGYSAGWNEALRCDGLGSPPSVAMANRRTK